MFRSSIARLVAFTVTSIVSTPRTARAQTKPFEITDNSFFVEEAFNQDPGVFQNIFTWARGETGLWEASFTQEWPAPGMAHQLSYTLLAVGQGTSARVGATSLNYRYQWLTEGPGRPAFSPRASLILPTGSREDDGNHPGLQVNLPFSKQSGMVYVHWNAGFTWLHGVPTGTGDRTDLTTPTLAGSVVWNTRPRFNLMLETVLAFDSAVDDDIGTRHDRILTVSPGFRGGWNFGEKQIVVGAAVPVTVAQGQRNVAILTYFSYELPFRTQD